ncbi:MAG: hypothetical protein WD557_02140 [Dehalococcoidia bacterium]
MTLVIIGIIFVVVGLGLIVTAVASYRVVARQSSRLPAIVAAGLFGGPGTIIALYGLSLVLRGLI